MAPVVVEPLLTPIAVAPEELVAPIPASPRPHEPAG